MLGIISCPGKQNLCVALAFLWVSGCSLFGPDLVRLDATTLRQDDLFVSQVVAVPSEFVRQSTGVIQSHVDEAEFRQRVTTASFPDIDYTVQSLVYVVHGPSEVGGRVQIERVEIRDREVVVVTATVDRSNRRVEGGTYPAHLVRVARLPDTVTGVESSIRTLP